MSSDLSYFYNLFADPFPLVLLDSINILQENNQFPVDEPIIIDQFDNNLFPCSSPSHLFDNLSLCQTHNHLQQESANGYQDFACLDSIEVKGKDSHVGFDIHSSHNQIQQKPLVLPHRYCGVENLANYIQRSYSSNSFDDNKPVIVFQPPFDSLLESPNFNNQSLSSPENSFFAGQMRRACSTGDLQYATTPHKVQWSFSNPLATESSFKEEANFKVSRYSAEERKERIAKYKAKKNRRNYDKTIRYACRKTLADNRPRIRGKFAPNDEPGEIPKAACSARDEDEDELRKPDGLQKEEEDVAIRGGSSASSFGQHRHQLQYCGYY